MVNTNVIRQWNSRFASEQHHGRVGVFSGATGGIGGAALTRMVQNLHKSTFYVLGRSEDKFAKQRAELLSLNPSNNIVFLQAQVSLLSDIDAACKRISASEDKVDFVYMSPGTDMGAALLNGPQRTEEGIEQTFAISYYGRIRLVQDLIPLLRQSDDPRVLSVLNGGREESIREDDLGLENGWSVIRVGSHTTTLTSLAFEHLAATNQAITFLHAFPGMVKTDIINRLTPPDSAGIAWKMALASFRGVGSVVMGCFGTEVQDCGDRQAYLLTSDKLTPGAWRINASSEKVTAPGVLKRYREQSLAKHVWQHTMTVFDKSPKELDVAQ